MYKYNLENKTNARKLRKEMTPWERKLWFTFLVTLEYKFKRQKLIGNYILDFYCANKKLAVELDGSQHYEPEKEKYDIERTKYLNNLGIKVLRYTNLDIDKRFESVCEDIFSVLKN